MRALRTTIIEAAWLWFRHQPGSALSRWFQERVRTDRGRLRRKSASGPTAVIARDPAILLVITSSITCKWIRFFFIGTNRTQRFTVGLKPFLLVWVTRRQASRPSGPRSGVPRADSVQGQIIVEQSPRMERHHDLAIAEQCSKLGDMDCERRLNIPHSAVIPPSTNSRAPVT